MRADKRNALLLTGATALALSAHLAAQPLWLAAVLVGLIALRAAQVLTGGVRIRSWLLLALAPSLIFLVFQAHHTLIGREGGMALLAGLVTLKLLEAGERERDANILFLLGYFCSGASFLQSQSPWMFALALLSTLALLACQLALQRPQDAPGRPLRQAARLMLEALPLALLLFVLFPRLPGPLWRMPAENVARSGLSADRMEPGLVSQLALDDSVAFRVEFSGPPPRHALLYWRGPVFEYFDGRGWLSPQRYGRAPAFSATGMPVEYTITLEPNQQRWLLALDLPTRLPPGAQLASRLLAVFAEPVTQRRRYTLTSYLNWRVEADPNVRFALQLPPGSNPRALALAANWRNLPPPQRVRSALDYLRNGHFAYTLEPPLLNGPDTVDQFLFDTRQGFCEHFAGAFAFLMRAAGVPARVVTGYQGGDYNAAGRYLIVRQADAHAWVEVWLDGQGWQRVDPTAAAAPARIETGLARSIAQGNELPLMLRGDGNWIKTVRLQLDVLVNGWNQWVIGFDAERQRDFLRRLGIDDFLSAQYLGWLLGGAGLILGGFALLALSPRRLPLRDPAARAYQRFCRKLAARGVVREAQEGPLDFARRAAAALPAQAGQIEAITADYLAVRYGAEPARLPDLRQRVNEL
ncbi:MAG: DUF3488 and transglutaminase-like domain-containing protein [Formivibrio sp.]|nr:DUF3488 and transglutaminase-like domain-containing protein [Formivibrio sp.]